VSATYTGQRYGSSGECETVNDAARPGSGSPISYVGEVRQRELAVVRQQAPIELGAHSAIAGGHKHALGAAAATTEWQRHSEAPATGVIETPPKQWSGSRRRGP